MNKRWFLRISLGLPVVAIVILGIQAAASAGGPQRPTVLTPAQANGHGFSVDESLTVDEQVASIMAQTGWDEATVRKLNPDLKQIPKYDPHPDKPYTGH